MSLDDEGAELVGAKKGMDVRPDHIMQFFNYAHLPPELQRISAPFGQMAHDIVAVIPQNPERTVALRKLLECKDAAVRAYKAGPSYGPEVGRVPKEYLAGTKNPSSERT